MQPCQCFQHSFCLACTGMTAPLFQEPFLGLTWSVAAQTTRPVNRTQAGTMVHTHSTHSTHLQVPEEAAWLCCSISNPGLCCHLPYDSWAASSAVLPVLIDAQQTPCWLQRSLCLTLFAVRIHTRLPLRSRVGAQHQSSAPAPSTRDREQ